MPATPSPRQTQSASALCISNGALLAFLVAWLGLDQLLLWRFLDVAPLWGYVVGMAVVAGLCITAVRVSPSAPGPGVRTVAVCFALSLIVLILGGEGRLLYANIDWQVRLAALRDMAVNPWPFVYASPAESDVLRAPVGMFLLPSLAFKALGNRAGDMALLVQNSILLTVVMALASQLFATRRAKLCALLAFLCFSGMDVIGDLVLNGMVGEHLEDWMGLQYSATITQAFWVPQHALAGWIGALGYMLWRTDRLPLCLYLAVLPLTALWSPLGLMGAMPFALLAGVRTIMAGRLGARDILLPALSSLLVVPSLLYMVAAGDAVGLRLQPLPPTQWLTFQAIETLPYLIPLFLARTALRLGRDTLWIIALWLAFIPIVQIGWSIDFMMRASATALALLAVMVADHLAATPDKRVWLIAVLAIGSLTGAKEIRRALVHPPAPEVRCSVAQAWDQSFSDFPKGTYLAPLRDMPAPVRPESPALVPTTPLPRCWDGDWYRPRNTRPRELRRQDSVKRQADRKG
jgi:hypothetical protein